MTNSAEPIIIIDEEDKHHILGYFQHGYTKILHEIMNTNLELIYLFLTKIGCMLSGAKSRLFILRRIQVEARNMYENCKNIGIS